MSPTTPAPPGGATTRPAGPGRTVASNTTEPAIDVQQLADKVYRLLLADLSVQIGRAGGERR